MSRPKPERPDVALLNDFAAVHHSTVMLMERRMQHLLRRERVLARNEAAQEIAEACGLDRDEAATFEVLKERLRLTCS